MSAPDQHPRPGAALPTEEDVAYWQVLASRVYTFGDVGRAYELANTAVPGLLALVAYQQARLVVADAALAQVTERLHDRAVGEYNGCGLCAPNGKSCALPGRKAESYLEAMNRHLDRETPTTSGHAGAA